MESMPVIFVFWRCIKNLRRSKPLQKILNISVLTVDGLQMQRKISVILDH